MEKQQRRSGTTIPTTLAAAAALAFAVAACDSSDPAPPPAATDQEVTIRFEAVVGADPFHCGSTYTLGTAGSTFEPRDLRFYVHDVKLIYHDGSVVPLAMTNDGSYQKDGVALLDFEDATFACSTSGATSGFNDPGMHTAITGRGPVGHVHGVQFAVGVPESVNHLLASSAAPPLNRPGLFWSWTSGYRHMRIDGNITSVAAPNLFNFHLGSTGCANLDPADPSKGAACQVSNRPVVYLPVLDAETQTVVFDVEQLFSTTNLDHTSTGAGNNPGCMSGATDPECGPIFARLGLPFDPHLGGTTVIGQQQVFRASP